MKNQIKLILALLIFFFLGCTSKKEASITLPKADVMIDVNKVLSKTSPFSVGLNVNFWFDSDKYKKRGRSLEAALMEMGVKTLRYPGGSKSQKDLWSVSPFEKSQPTVCRMGDNSWPWNNAPTVFNPDGSYTNTKMDFDEFMTLCKKIGAQPVLVINCQGYKNPDNAISCVTKEQLLVTAKEWVRYANITKGYNVKYWEIGNEPSLDDHMGGKWQMTADEYAAIVNEFSKIMKSVDPTIKIGAWRSWSPEWMKTILEKTVKNIDFLICHSYYAPAGLNDYRGKPLQETEALKDVYEANKAIDNLPEPYRSEIKIAVTEFGAREWTGIKWPEKSDWSHALVNFDLMGHMLKLEKVDFTAFWNTRWFGLDDYSCATLTEKDNNLTAIGKSIAFMANNIQPTMIESFSSHFTISSFSSYDPKKQKLVVFLLNKNDSDEEISLDIKGMQIKQITKQVLTGTSINDLYPQLSEKESILPVKGNAPQIIVKAFSITLLEIN
jgi:alpha-N-arabinofuranosidase